MRGCQRVGEQAWGREARVTEPETGLTRGPCRTLKKEQHGRGSIEMASAGAAALLDGGGGTVTQTSIAGTGRMVMPLLEVRKWEGGALWGRC